MFKPHFHSIPYIYTVTRAARYVGMESAALCGKFLPLTGPEPGLDLGECFSGESGLFRVIFERKWIFLRAS